MEELDKVEINLDKIYNEEPKTDYINFEYEAECKELKKLKEDHLKEIENLLKIQQEKTSEQFNLNSEIEVLRNKVKEECISKKNQVSINYQERVNFLQTEIKNLEEKEIERQNGSAFEKIFNYFSWNKEREVERKAKQEKTLEIDKLSKEKLNFMNLIDNNYHKEIAKIEIDNKDIIDKLSRISGDLLSIKQNLNFLDEDIKFTDLKLSYINSKDKEIVKKLAELFEKVLKIEVYPSRKILKEITSDSKKIISKYRFYPKLINYDENLERLFDIDKNVNLEQGFRKLQFIEKELNAVDEMLSDIDGKSLDNQQRIAVITEEDNNLVVAGAGSGKTLTISAKVKYLVSRLGVQPKEILLITFTKKAAEEMEERIAKKLGIDVKVKTFHALGYDVLGFFEKGKPDIYEGIEVFTEKFKKEIVSKDDELKKNLFEYFTTYMNDFVNPTDFDCLGEFYRANKYNSFEPIKFKIEKMRKTKELEKFNVKLLAKIEEIYKIKDVKNISLKINEMLDFVKKEIKKMKLKTSLKQALIDIENSLEEISKEWNIKAEHDKRETAQIQQSIINSVMERMQRENRTLKRERVKSLEELIIANFFYSNGIEYVYEGNYKYSTADSGHRQYKPDFYLPEADIYLEHFGIDENGRCPQYSTSEEIKYLEGIKWKRELHKSKKTIMEETYSFDHKRGKLVAKLEAIVKKYNIKKKPLTNSEIVETLLTLDQDNEFKEFYKLLNTFLSLFKSCGYNEDDIDRFIIRANQNDNQYTSQKHTLFLKIFKKYFIEYQNELLKTNTIDFNDMINRATKYIKDNYLPFDFKFKYIIIDEFQDISVARYKLIKAIKDKNDSKIVAVGDDWQSIYRFAGSEISIFTKFAQYFGETEVLKIEKTYRNSQQLIDIAGRFVMSNPDQIKKDLKSDKICEKPVEIWEYDERALNDVDEDNSLSRVLISILKSLGNKKQSVVILGRNNFDIMMLNDSKFFGILHKDNKVIVKCNLFPNLEITFMSIHKSKGLEADQVIILNNKNTLTGFPNKMVSDSVLDYVTNIDETYLYAEERRLFYVGLTRTKNKCFLTIPIEHSIFSEELKKYKDITYIPLKDKPEQINCPACKTGILVKAKGLGGRTFYHCSNYPQCNYKIDDTKNIKSKVRCPKCGAVMTLRKGKYGEFYGCTNYPTCKGTLTVEEYERLEK